MEYIVLLVVTILVFSILVSSILVPILLLTNKNRKKRHKYDRRGFDNNRNHKNGTKYDDFGFDFYGYDIEGYSKQGYNRYGKNRKGQYDRFFDITSCECEGFYNLKNYPITLTTHARERFCERLGITDFKKMDMFTIEAYRFGKSKRQIKKTSAYLVDEIEQNHDNSVVLIYKNTIYIFSCENVLKTVYKNNKIPL